MEASMKLRTLWLALLLAPGLGCVVREVRPERPACRERGAFWVEGWRDGRGYWHPGHWECR
jgi:hypothetical protein